jgi:hypothetical protein
MAAKKRQKRRIGDLLAIPLPMGGYAFGHVLTEPLIAFYDSRRESIPSDPAEVTREPVAFKLWVMNHAITDGTWPVVGSASPSPELLTLPKFFKQDPITKRLSVTTDGEDETLASLEECASLERAAVWEPTHVVDRLVDHFSGQPNKWAESLRPK